MLLTNYKLYKDGELVHEGVASEIHKFCGLNKSFIKKYAENNLVYKGKYTFKINGKIEHCPQFLGGSKIMSDEEYLLFHLKKYGNTTFNKDPSPYVDYLKQNGLEIEWKNSKIKKKHFILEVVNAN